MSILNKASNYITKRSKFHRNIANAAGNFVETGSKRSLGKVMAPFGAAALGVGALYGIAAAGGGKAVMSAAARGLSRGRARARMPRAPKRLADFGRSVGNVAKGGKGKVLGAATGAIGVGAGAYGLSKASEDTTKPQNQTNNDFSVIKQDPFITKYTPQNNGKRPGGKRARGGLSRNEWEKKTGQKWKNTSIYKAQQEWDKTEKERLNTEKALVQKNNAAGWQSTSQEYDRLMDFLPGQENAARTDINTISNSQKRSIDGVRKTQLAKFDGYRDNVRTEQKKSLRDLAGNIRNMLQAGNIYLGTRNASNSSANPMYAYALTKSANRQRASIRNQGSSSLKDLDLRAADIDSASAKQMNDIDTWENTQYANIKREFADKIQSLRTQKASTRQEFAAQLMNYMANIDTQAREFRQQLKLNAQTQSAQTPGYTQAISALGNVQGTPEISYNPLMAGNIREGGKFDFNLDESQMPWQKKKNQTKKLSGLVQELRKSRGMQGNTGTLFG